MREMALEVLGILEKAGEAVSGMDIADKLKISPPDLELHIEELQNLGYVISRQDSTFLLEAKTERLLPNELQSKLRTRFVGRNAFYFDSVPSTLAVAKRLCEEGDPKELNGTLIIAEQQTGGMGRLGRLWASPPGGIWTTIILKPNIPVDRLFMITMAGSLAVARAIRREYEIGALIKWPNDIFIGSKKVAGLLQEISVDDGEINYVVLGLGIDANINVNELPDELKVIATSLNDETGESVDRVKLLARVLKEFELRLLQIESGEYETIVREWKSLSITLNRRVHVKTLRKTFKGEAIDIDQNGALVIRKDNGDIEKVIAGDLV